MTITDIARPEVKILPPALRLSIKNQISVIHALILHDIKSRFFGNGIGYLVTIIWPFGHLALLMIIHVVAHRATPYGTSGLLYVSTGVYPFIVWNYISRFTMLGAVMNKSYLSYPIINLLDIIFARILLEINTSYVILVLLCVFLAFNGIPLMPLHLNIAVLGVLSAAVFGIGCAVLGAVITSMFPLFMVIMIVPILLGYTTSGIIFNPENLPRQIAEFFYWNPLLHSVEMVRSAYYPDYPTSLLDIRYPFVVGLILLSLGLLLERMYTLYWK